jgi:hypothetical protein
MFRTATIELLCTSELLILDMGQHDGQRQDDGGQDTMVLAYAALNFGLEDITQFSLLNLPKTRPRSLFIIETTVNS